MVMEMSGKKIGSGRPGANMATRVHAAPTSLGSSRITSVETAGFRLTDARFPSGLVLERHSHERACLTVVLDGSFVERFRGQELECGVSTLLFKTGGEPHSDLFANTGSWQLIVEPADDRLESLQHQRLFDRIGCVRRDALALAHRAVREVHSGDPLAPLALEGIAIELLVLLGRTEQAGVDRRPPPWLLRVRTLLHDGFRLGMTLDDLAREADVHPMHLAREFRRHIGVSPADYRRRLQLDWVRDRLAASAAPIAAIAIQAGFFDQSHLTRSFRRAFGETPAEYRARTRGRPA